MAKVLFVAGPVAMVLGVWRSSLGLTVVGLLWFVLSFACHRHGRTLRAAMKEKSDPSGVTVPMVVTGAVLYLCAGVPAIVVGLTQWEISDPDLRWIPIVIGGAVTALALLSTGLYLLGSGLQAVVGEPPTVPATIAVVSSRQTGTYINEMPRIEFVLDVTPEGGTTYQVTKKATVPFTAIGAIQPGCGFRAKVVGPEDPTNMEIDWESPVGAATPTEPLADRLKELDTLRDQGLVTEAEHAEQRRRLLDSL